MAITFDAPSSGTAGNVSTITVSHTCTGSNRILFVALWTNTTSGTVTATYNGVSMTQISSSSANFTRSYLFYIVNPAPGANNIIGSISGASANAWKLAAASYAGTFQSGQPDASSTDGNSPSVTPVASGCWVVATAFDDSTGITCNGTQRANPGGFAIQDSNGIVSSGIPYVLSFSSSSGNPQSVIASFVPDFPPATGGNLLLMFR